jgi:hypothetical protein
MRALMITLAVLSIPALSIAACSDDEEDDTTGAGATTTSSVASSASAGGSDQGGMGGEGGGAGGEPSAGGTGPGGGGGAGGGAGGGVGGDSGYSGPDCVMCLNPLVAAQGQCSDEYMACTMDQPCNAWLDCTQDCFQPPAQAGCWAACDAANPDAMELVADFYDCVCGDCAAVCGTACN